MKKLLPLLALAVSLAAPAFAASDDDLRKSLIGAWGDDESCDTGILVFHSDGTFTSARAGDPGSAADGYYRVSSGRLAGVVDGETMPEVRPVIEDGKLYFQNDAGDRHRLFPCGAKPQ